MSDTTATSSLTEVADELDSDDSNSTCLSHSSSSPVKQKPSAGQCFHGVGCTQGVMPLSHCSKSVNVFVLFSLVCSLFNQYTITYSEYMYAIFVH